jgi:hypothetical protein
MITRYCCTRTECQVSFAELKGAKSHAEETGHTLFEVKQFFEFELQAREYEP